MRTSTVRSAAHVLGWRESAPVPTRAHQTKEGVHVHVRVDGRSRGSCSLVECLPVEAAGALDSATQATFR